LVSGSAGSAVGLERLLTVREIAMVLHVATSTVYQLCAGGKLAHVRVSNAIRLAPGAVAEYVRTRSNVSES
jgi:excisionase family DNA binding protein